MTHWATLPQRGAEVSTRVGFRLHNRLIGPWRQPARSERPELIEGLFADPARIAPKYLYDAIGCALFEAICELPEYYLTRTERAIFAAHRDAIAALAGRHRQFVDLGAGDCRKGESWIAALAPRRFIAVDIAQAAIEPALVRLATAYPDIEFTGVLTDFSRSLDLGADLEPGPVTFFYPGSSIGNFAPDDALGLLTRIRRLCGRSGGLLIGVDVPKEAARLAAAYDDSLGVTAAFNRNVLNHVNALVGSDFDPAAFAHVALYNARESRIEMHLEALRAQCVLIDGRERVFGPGERIHTENSYKYAPEQFAAVLRRAGFADIAVWQDEAGDFAVYYAE
ncbi:MAG TPA: L-histidine N(alpha)-methyltransferase [Casimicrobiaceae bacterium]|nr:L-histidine N(alpha)-methyltransferase [Casimicrobiaceae bacterium]